MKPPDINFEPDTDSKSVVKKVAAKHGIAASSVYGYIKGGKSAVTK